MSRACLCGVVHRNDTHKLSLVDSHHSQLSTLRAASSPLSVTSAEHIRHTHPAGQPGTGGGVACLVIKAHMPLENKQQPSPAWQTGIATLQREGSGAMTKPQLLLLCDAHHSLCRLC